MTVLSTEKESKKNINLLKQLTKGDILETLEKLLIHGYELKYNDDLSLHCIAVDDTVFYYSKYFINNIQYRVIK